MSTVNLGCKLDLKKIALHARNAEYNPKVCYSLFYWEAAGVEAFRWFIIGGILFKPVSNTWNMPCTQTQNIYYWTTVLQHRRGPARVNSDKRHGPKRQRSSEIATNDWRRQMYVAKFPTALCSLDKTPTQDILKFRQATWDTPLEGPHRMVPILNWMFISSV